MIKKISHVGIVVRDMDEALKLFEKVFNLKPAVVKEAMGGKLKVAFIPVGDDEIELLQPLDMEIPFGKFLQTHGQGIHHISLATDNIEDEIERMKKEGVTFDAEKPRIGAHGVKIIFTKPETTGKIAVELCQES
ncbi:MAG: VOC family protein [Nitrososphaerota archaeon]|nr:VOC family protein [Nitrososphaerales archaeon]MCX8192123.1 VOC family protein [Nitrososphaerales archaeon]MDW8045032.1 VOC family protein [Nitrososphaerota archaeon]